MTAADYAFFADRPVGFAHRGGALYGPNVGLENTLAAFANAVALGYRYLETDVHASKDGVPVIFHDDRLDRVTDRTGLICHQPWSEVRRAKVGGTEQIPTLDDLLDAFPEARINVDLKIAEAVEPVWRAIKRHRAYDRVCVASFSERRLGAFRKLAGTRVATAMTPVGIAAFRLLPQRLAMIARGQAQVLEVPPAQLLAGRTVPVVTPQLLQAAHSLGLQVHVWTIDYRAEMERLLDLGVDAIHSDRIDILRDVLTERGLWPS
ncbi:MAG TPA: glycerophosphodiester phosphodiesterase [Dermatophilaceae bacterium]|nr:glycerophosphodiester phosphodiesterase [Dermatophilaceae bacterium]